MSINLRYDCLIYYKIFWVDRQIKTQNKNLIKKMLRDEKCFNRAYAVNVKVIWSLILLFNNSHTNRMFTRKSYDSWILVSIIFELSLQILISRIKFNQMWVGGLKHG